MQFCAGKQCCNSRHQSGQTIHYKEVLSNTINRQSGLLLTCKDLYKKVPIKITDKSNRIASRYPLGGLQAESIC